MSVVVDLERMGDHAAGIGRTVLRMDGPPPDAPLAEMQRMAEVCRDMLRAGLRAFLARNAEAARSVAGRDEEIDQRYQKIFRGLIQSMVDDPKTTSAALYLLFTAHNLERIGDGITNIAERVIFMTSGVMRELNPDPPPPQRL
jgi:phosphate transport system protein